MARQVGLFMMRRASYALIWLAISLLAGAAGSYFLDVSFWAASLIAGVGLVANGLIAEWEDRQHDR